MFAKGDKGRNDMGMYDDIFSIKEELEELEKYGYKKPYICDYDFGCLVWFILLIVVETIYFLFFD